MRIQPVTKMGHWATGLEIAFLLLMVVKFSQFRLPLPSFGIFGLGIAGFAGTDVSRGLGNLGGSLPFSVVFDRRGAVVHQKVGKLSEVDLAQWAALD